MTELSPAAQATYDAFNSIGLYNEHSFDTDRKALAAALRAAADQVVPSAALYARGCCEFVGERCRADLLAIAAELDNHTTQLL